MKQALKRKLRSQAGESIGETLVSLLISALALVMLASAISASYQIVMTSRTRLTEYYNAAETMVNPSESGPASPVTTAGKVTITGGSIQDITIDVTYYENDTYTETPVIAY